MPEIIGVNTDVQTEPPLIQLSNSPCLSELLSYDTHVTSSCHVTRSRNIQTGIMNIDNDVWLFSHNEWPLQCHVHSNTGEFGGIISINEPSIVRVPCGNAIKCTNAELPSSACINRSVLIKSSVTGKHEQLSTIPWPIKTMTKQLISTYKLTISNSLKDILDDLKDNRLTVTSVIKEFGALVFVLVLSIIGYCLQKCYRNNGDCKPAWIMPKTPAEYGRRRETAR
ncbi:unnamed protein product, partial [Didymodactylos carnosus]